LPELKRYISLIELVKGTTFRSILLYLISVGLGLIIGGALPALAINISPMEVYQTIFYASLGNMLRISETLVKTIPLWLIGLGIAVAFSSGFWNIGAEGQFYWGAIAAIGIGIIISGMNLPPPIAILLILIAGFLAGALWALIPAVLKVYLGVNEIIVTVMMNFIAIYFAEYLILGPWRDPAVPEPMTYALPLEARLPKILPGTPLHAGIFIAIIATLVAYVILEKTPLGFEIKCVGNNPKAALWSGINLSKVVISSMLLSGGLAGLAGVCEITGIHYRLLRGVSPGYGFLAIIVALLAKLSPLGVPASAFFFAMLLVGADALQRTVKIPVSAVYVIQAVILLSVIVLEIVLRRGLKR